MFGNYKKSFKNILNFEDRTSRGDFWLSILSLFTITFMFELFVFGLIGGLFGEVGELISNILVLIYSLVLFVCCLSLQVRRLHDVNKSGWFIFIEFIPVIGSILLLIALCSKTVEPNKYGKQI